MATDHIRYDVLARDALRGVLRRVLSDAAEHGLPGEHHFYITFLSHGDGVKLSTRLLAQPRRELHAGRARVERDVEMMLARQAAGLGHVGEHAAHHRTQRLLGQQIVADVIDRHSANLKTRGEM